MSDKTFYADLILESGVTDQTYKAITKSILENDELTESQKVDQLRLMSEAFDQCSTEFGEDMIN